MTENGIFEKREQVAIIQNRTQAVYFSKYDEIIAFEGKYTLKRK